MKPSKFNIIFKYKDNWYVTNTFSKSIVKINENVRDSLSDNKLDRLTQIEQDTLKSKGLAVDDSLDEISLLRYQAFQTKNSKAEMEFVIAPTLDCNFRCTYCFEDHVPGVMSAEMQKKVLNFIYNKTEDALNKKIHIIWFGGEPLICTDIVTKMNQEIYNFCKENNKELKSDIITNGYTLTKNVIKNLELSHIQHLQITLDGTKNIHDTRRIFKDGSGTYERIFSNLKLLSGSSLTVSLRVNVDRSNIDSLQDLENEIKALNNPNIHLAVAVVEISEKHNEDLKSSCYHGDDSMEAYYHNPIIQKYHKNEKAADYGLRLFFCEAEHYHSYAIDNNGNVFKCWNLLGHEKERLCTVDDIKENPAVLSTYFGRDCFTEDKCKNCAYIPICAGGCISQKQLYGENFCADSKYLFLDAVKNEIDQKGR